MGTDRDFPRPQRDPATGRAHLRALAVCERFPDQMRGEYREALVYAGANRLFGGSDPGRAVQLAERERCWATELAGSS